MPNMSLQSQYKSIRKHSEKICEPLQKEDYVVQPVADVSPPKWHLGHTTWFFETFILKPHLSNYQEFNTEYNYVFNSYYETVGARVIRTDRGNLSRPTVTDVYQYRAYVDQAMDNFLSVEINDDVKELLILGLNHEQQHQELLAYDIKYILGHNPLFPAYADEHIEQNLEVTDNGWLKINEGIYDIGYSGEDFCFDTELGKHKVYIQNFEISKDLISNKQYLEFLNSGGYQDFKFWHAEGWDWVNQNQIKAPLYWHFLDGAWFKYDLAGGLKPINLNDAVSHISYYEAAAFAAFSEKRLPTEFEWEIASAQFNWGKLWEWTGSAYLPYPGFSKAPGAIGEYNGKFMVNQKVLRGASVATPINHQRNTYRNFFSASLRWQYCGIRLAK